MNFERTTKRIEIFFLFFIMLFLILSLKGSATDNTTGFPLPTGTSYKVSALSNYSSGARHKSYLYIYGPVKKQAYDEYCVADIPAPAGTSIYAVADGKIHTNAYGANGGNYLVIAHNDGTYSYYGHMQSQSTYKVGTAVKAGDVIGYVGKTGNATGYHLHFEWSEHDPYCEYTKSGYINGTTLAASVYPHQHSSSSNNTSDTVQATYTVYVTGTGSALSIRKGTSSSSTKLGRILEGDSCTVYPNKSIGNWYWVEYNGIQGYAYSKYLTTTAPETKVCTSHVKGQYLFYQAVHPHYNYYLCANCGEKFTDYSTTTMDTCEICHPAPAETPAPTPKPTPTPPDDGQTYYCFVNVDTGYLSINDAPAASSSGKSNKIGRIPSGAAVTVYPEKASGSWYWVEYNGVSGYASKNYLTTEKPATQTGTVTGTKGEYLAINDAAASSSAGKSNKIGRIPPGGTVTVYVGNNSGNWYWVCYDGTYGWAYGGYITLD